MKKVIKKLLSLEPMSKKEREAVALLPVVAVFGFGLFGVAVVFG